MDSNKDTKDSAENPLIFPSKENTLNDNEGMLLRDWFAGMALQGMLNKVSANYNWTDVNSVAKDIYEVADAMLKARLDSSAD